MADIKDKLELACMNGNLDYVLHCIANNLDEGKSIDWDHLFSIASRGGFIEIMKCIQESGRLELWEMLESACASGDLPLWQNIDWWRLLCIAHQSNRTSIVQCILDSDMFGLSKRILFAALSGDVEFVTKCIADTDISEHDIVWINPLDVAYMFNNIHVVRCIQSSGHIALQKLLWVAGMKEDMEFVSQCIAENRDWDNSIEWERIVHAAYFGNAFDIARHIYEQGRLELQTMLQFACLFNDVSFVSHVIHNNTDCMTEVDWDEVITDAFIKGGLDILGCIGAVFPDHVLFSHINGDMDCVQKGLADCKHCKLERERFVCYVLHYISGHKNISDYIIDSGYITVQNKVLQTIVAEGLYKPAVDHLIQHIDPTYTPLQPQFTRLHRACYTAVPRCVQPLIDAGSDVNAAGYMGWTPLHMLCVWGNEDIERLSKDLNLTIDAEERLQSKDKIMKQLGHVLNNSFQKRKDVLSTLIANGGKVNVLDINGQSPLHLACMSGVHEVVTGLLAADADIDALDGVGMTPVALAAAHGHRDIVITLLRNNCDKHIQNHYKQSPLYHACRWNQYGVARLLSDSTVHKEKINKADCDGVTAIAIAAWHGHTGIVSMLLNKDADANIVDIELQTPLHKVAMTGCIETTCALVKHNVMLDVQDITGSTPLHIASQKHVNTVTQLWEAGCKVDVPNDLGNTALHVAVSSRQYSIVLSLLSFAANVNLKNNCSESPLNLACTNLDLEIMMLLVSAGADISTTDNMGRGLAHVIVMSLSHVTTFQQHIFSNMPMNIKDYDRNVQQFQFRKDDFNQSFYATSKAISATITNQQFERETISSAFFVTPLLYVLSKGVDINACDHNGQTPLHLAALSGYQAAVVFLLKQGADVAARDKFGYTPAMLAIKYPEIMTKLWDNQGPLSEPDASRCLHLAHWYDVSPDACSIFGSNHEDFTGYPQEVRAIQNIEINQGLDVPRHWSPNLQSLTYVDHPIINKVLSNFMADLAASVEDLDPLFAFDICRCGSEDEHTKVLSMNEQDIICMMKNLTFGTFEIPVEPGDVILKAFVELKCKEEHTKALKCIIDEEHKLQPKKLFQCFSHLVSKTLANKSIWQKYPQLQRVTTKDITSGNRTISALHIRWHDAIYPMLDISIDIVPALYMTGWWPSWCNQHSPIKTLDCIAVPKWKATAPSDKALMEVGICKWGQVFQDMPEGMRQGYRISKVVRSKAVCPQIEEWPEVGAEDFITSYMLKQCIVKEYAGSLSESRDSLILDVFRIIYERQVGIKIDLDLFWARRIYDMMEEAFNNQHLESFFIPGYNLLHDDKYAQYRETAIGYARLCKRLLTTQSAKHFRKAYLGSANT